MFTYLFQNYRKIGRKRLLSVGLNPEPEPKRSRAEFNSIAVRGNLMTLFWSVMHMSDYFTILFNAYCFSGRTTWSLFCLLMHWSLEIRGWIIDLKHLCQEYWFKKYCSHIKINTRCEKVAFKYKFLLYSRPMSTFQRYED